MPTARVPLVFFRVARALPRGLRYFRVDPEATTMVQEGVAHSRVPFAVESYLHRGPRGEGLPAAVAPHHRALTRLFLPFLAGRSRNGSCEAAAAARCRVLVSGSRRSLKQVLVASVARHLGLHLVSCNMFELLAPSERQTARNLRAKLREAVQCRPAVIHLRRLNAVAEHAQAHQQGESQLLAMLVRDLTHELSPPEGSEAARGHPILFVASCENASALPAKLQSVFTHQINITPPDIKTRAAMFTAALREELEAGPARSSGGSNGSRLGRRDNSRAQNGERAVAAAEAKAGQALRERAEELAAKTAGISAGEIRHIVGLAGAIRTRDELLGLEAGGGSDDRKGRAEASEPGDRVVGADAHADADANDTKHTYSPADGRAVNGGRMNGDRHHLPEPQPQPSQAQSGGGGGSGVRAEHFQESLKMFQGRASSGASLARVPDVRWSDIGGLEHVKREILDTIQLPLRHPELFGKGLKQRSGILLYGPPGTGKTLIAKAVATECSLNFISVKGPELLNMYIGESEKNVRDVFERARNAKPCVLFFDEMDSVAPKRGQGSDSGGVMDRVVSQLLTELDGMNDSTDVFIIGATNRPDLVDTALTRPGRLDRLVYLGVSSTRDAQLKIVQALTRKFHLAKGVDLRKVVDKCSFNFTGADFYALCSDAMLYAVKRKIATVDQLVAERKKLDKIQGGDSKDVNARLVLDEMPPEQLQVQVRMEDFEEARSRLNPSLSHEELQHYVKLQKQFEMNKKR